MDASRLSYKPGWSFKIAGPGNQYLCIFSITPDSGQPERTRCTQHQFRLPDPPLNDREFARWVLDRLLQCEQHETCEFFRIDGFAPFYPNHQDEGSPYDLVERWES